MHKKVITLITILVVISIVSCSNSVLETLGRVDKLPTVEKPVVESFVEMGSINLSWNSDIAAEQYIVWRSEDLSTPDFKEIYRGNRLSYIDKDIPAHGRGYLYTLGKIRGSKIFGPSDPVYGLGSMVRRDTHEPNDEKSSAKKLIWDLQANLYHYQSVSGNRLSDRDWYSLDIAPRKRASIVLTQEGLSEGETNTWLMFSQDGHVEQSVINSQGITIDNTSYETKTFHFLITPKESEFISDPTQAGGGIINYNVSLHSISSL